MTFSRAAILPLSVAILTLTGCVASFEQSAQLPGPAAAVALTGHAFGGQQPLVGATLQLYAASTSGYAAASTPLLTLPVVSGPGGNFTISYDYACPSSATQVYLTATGGNPGLALGTNNQQIAMIAALGSCGNLTTSTNIVINEATTVAAVWALAPFMADLAHVGTSSTNVIGLTNAFLTAAQLVNTGNGGVPGVLPAGAIAPISQVNTLADILSACINTAGGIAGDSTACGKLLTYATPLGATAPTDTVSAALNIAQNPALNVAKLYALVTSTAPFNPTYASAPNDLTLGIIYFGAPRTTSLDIDSSQNIWLMDPALNNDNGHVVTMNNQGYLTSTASGYTTTFFSPQGIALDQSNNLWIGESLYVNSSPYYASKLTSAANLLFNIYPYPATNYFNGIAVSSNVSIGPAGQAWFWGGSNAQTSTLSEFSSTGNPISPVTYLNAPKGFTGGGYSYGPIIRSLSLDPSNNAWFIFQTSNYVYTLSEISGSGTVLSPSTGYTTDMAGATTTAIDHEGDIWVTSENSSIPSHVSELSPSGTQLSPSGGFPVKEISIPINSLFDGADTLWIVNGNYTNQGFIHVSHAGVELSLPAVQGYWLPSSPSSNVGSAVSTSNFAIDNSGSIWVGSAGYGSGIYGVTKMVGLAAPTVTPLALAVKNNQLGTRP